MNEVILSLQIPIIFILARLNTEVIIQATQTMHHYKAGKTLKNTIHLHWFIHPKWVAFNGVIKPSSFLPFLGPQICRAA